MTRKAGRPKGSGLKDGQYLDRIADALTRDPTKSANAAIMDVARKSLPEHTHDAFRRRLHRKWQTQGVQRLEAARQRQEERNRPVPTIPREAYALGGPDGPLARAGAQLLSGSENLARVYQQPTGLDAAMANLHPTGIKTAMASLTPDSMSLLRDAMGATAAPSAARALADLVSGINSTARLKCLLDQIDPLRRVKGWDGK